ncbi:hypothetical protein BZA05DRAFT_443395 [Tricharina praecox]|uniref:uncharacterized protein n=1 Tax=Tricharina praecox TaxID=43433 RepID=UPI00221FCFF0|nr:uncharacterized protein BZA05DRAFT_443395 [Tricharina praecox]KAI5854751.1 hypothetical protein BZA05DRAFT_443395 [Tricharina praecox]
MSSSSSAAARPSDPSTGVHFRQAFSYKDLDADGHHQDVVYMDDQSQEQLIQELQEQDLAHNEFYSKALRLLTASAIPYFVIRWYFYWSAGGWVLNNNVFFLGSLVISFSCVPEVTAARHLRHRDERRTRLQTGNIIFSCLLCFWTWTKIYSLGIREGPGVHEEYVCVFPFLIAVMGYGMERMMEAVNFGELEHLRYQYKGA